MAHLVDWVWQAVASIASWWMLAVLAALVVFFALALFAPRRRSYLPARTFDGRAEGFRPSQVETILSDFNPTQLQTYLNQARGIDMVFPILYSVMGAMAIVLFAPRLQGFRWLVLLPFLMALADYVENVCVITVIGRHRRGQSFGGVDNVLALATPTKYVFFGASSVALLLLIVSWAIRALRT